MVQQTTTMSFTCAKAPSSKSDTVEIAGTTAQLRPMAADGRASTESTPEQDWTEIPEGCGSRGRKL